MRSFNFPPRKDGAFDFSNFNGMSEEQLRDVARCLLRSAVKRIREHKYAFARLKLHRYFAARWKLGEITTSQLHRFNAIAEAIGRRRPPASL